MRKSRFSEEQIIGLLKQAEAGRPVAELCRQIGITDTTFCKWRSKFAGLEVSEARRLRQLEEENRRLKAMVARPGAGHPGAQRGAGPKMTAPALRRQAACQIIEAYGYSERRACQLVELNRRTMRRVPPPDRDEDLRRRLRELAEKRRRFGCPRLYLLLRREGLVVNHKRVERLYREEALSLRLRPKRKRQSHLRVIQPAPTGPNEQWTMDFVSDSLENGRRMKVLTIIDLWDRRCPRLEADSSIPGEGVVRVLEQLRQLGECSKHLRSDNGPEFTGKALDQWATMAGVQLEFIRPGRPIENGHVESFNGKFREECLNAHAVRSLAEARDFIEAWRQDYNTARPHSSLCGLAPEEYGRAMNEENQNSQNPNLRLVYSAG